MKSELTAKELFNYKMDDEETSIWNSLRNEILAIIKKLKVPNRIANTKNMAEMPRLKSSINYCIQYKKGFGFYEAWNEYGFSLLTKSPWVDREEFKYYLLKKEFENAGQTIEVVNRVKFELEWSHKNYNCKYDSRKFWLEYSLDKLIKVYLEKEGELIDYYIGCMGKAKWTYDKNKSEFIEIS